MFSGPTREWCDSLLQEQAGQHMVVIPPGSFANNAVAEPGDANYNRTEVSDLRLRRLARPEVVLSRIMRTNFRDLNASRELSCFFGVLSRAAIYGGCWIPLGQFNGVTYSFTPTSSILQLEDKVQDQQFAEPAPPAYFCVQKRDLAQVENLPWGGSSAPPSQPYATNIARSLSSRSVNSNDYGYSSENVHHVSKKLHYISVDKVEESAGFGLQDSKNASAGNRNRALSLRSVGSEDSGYSSSDPNSNLAVISEAGIDEASDFGLFNERKSESTNDLVNSFPFFTLGRLYSKPASSENLPTVTDFIVAISLADYSLWAIYDAWDEDWIEAEEGDEADWIGEERHETPLKPFWSSDWAKLPGLAGRVRMARLANNVYSHVFASSEQINWMNTGNQWGPDEIPVLFPAERALTGPVTSLTDTSQSKGIVKYTR